MQITRNDIEEKKKRLREEWKKKPWKRSVIIQQVKLLEMAVEGKPIL